MKDTSKLFGKMALYLLAVLVGLAAANALSYVGMTVAGITGGFLGGTDYAYNPIGVILSIVAACASVYWCYQWILKKNMHAVVQLKWWSNILLFLMILVFAVLSFVVNFIVTLIIIGIFNGVNSDFIWELNVTGYPLGMMIFLSVMYILNFRKQKKLLTIASEASESNASESEL